MAIVIHIAATVWFSGMVVRDILRPAHDPVRNDGRGRRPAGRTAGRYGLAAGCDDGGGATSVGELSGACAGAVVAAARGLGRRLGRLRSRRLRDLTGGVISSVGRPDGLSTPKLVGRATRSIRRRRPTPRASRRSPPAGPPGLPG